MTRYFSRPDFQQASRYYCCAFKSTWRWTVYGSS